MSLPFAMRLRFGAAIGAARSVVPARWWTRAPFLPVPDRRWLRYRMVTAYGGDGRAPMRADDVVTFVEWRREFTRAR